MTFRLILFFICLLPFSAAAQRIQTLRSPNGALQISIETSPTLSWWMQVRGKPLLQKTSISLEIEGHGVLGQKAKLIRSNRAVVDRTQNPVIHHKSATVSEQYSELTLTYSGDWGVVFRAYNEGLAYRFFTRFQKDEDVTVVHEGYQVRIASGKTILFPEETGFYSHNERVYKTYAPDALTQANLASLPTLLQAENGVSVLLTESNLRDYPGLWLRGSKDGSLHGVLPRSPKYTLQTSDRDIKVSDREPYIARCSGQRDYPWRAFLVAEKDADLLNNQLPWLLAEPNRISNADWIRPGKVAWDWWNNLNISGVDFKAGLNTQTYKHYVDFAAENDLEYIILDEGWTKPGDLMAINPDIDMDELADYAKAKKVGLILWVTWVSIDRQFDTLLPKLKKWDIKGLKVDFMQRDDQAAVNFYWRMAEKAAKNQLLLDFHGAHKPAGLHRTWPNVLTFEGVYGLEQSKWDKKKRIDPEHNVTLPFIRMVAGPMDYTPGAMLNYQLNDWSPSWSRPASLGTRCHELAKYIIFESPLQMLADSPTNYRKESECLQFLSSVPVVWENTIPLDSKIGDYVVLARKGADERWYIGAMTDWNARTLEIKLDFLPPGEYEMEVYADGPNAHRNAQDYQHSVKHIKASARDKITIDLAPGGGYVAVLRRL